MTVNDPATIARLLRASRTIAVVGLSSDPARPSYGVARSMQQHGYRIIPVNPHETQVLGETAYADLTSIPEPVDLVNIFRRPSEILAHVREAIAIGAPAIWLQLGVTNDQAIAEAVAAGLEVVADRCIAVEYRNLERPHLAGGVG